jgi:acyl-CoA thioesterase I
MPIPVQDDQTVLFIGDSITDTGRNRDDDSDMGGGYANFVAAWFTAHYPHRRVRFLNRGISGDRVQDLQVRWQRDCIDLKPDWVSILIGINNVIRRYDSNLITPDAEFAAAYRSLLQQVKQDLQAPIILLEPFVLAVNEDMRAWRADLNPKIDIIRHLAAEYGAFYVPLDGLFAAVAARRGMAFWLPDGVHPTQAGHALIAQAWLDAISE